ncbi:DoxX family protein [Hellea balneolensis]|uniref:DoxX family protein n=1 Tax=Hellea balneolensis TaxID=287478 RepID=UPI0004284F01|nr:DoxX family protein [Hellea balneolensis]
MLSSVSMTLGRALLGLYFLIPGLQKAANAAETLSYMKSHDIVFAEPLMWFSTSVNIVGGLLLMSGRHIRVVAYGFVIYILLVNFLLHDFWTMQGEGVARETQNFFKNMGILAGLLVLAGHSQARKISLSGWWRSDKVILR